MDKVQEALAYLAQGFCPIPVHGVDSGEYSKRPAINTWKEFSTRLPTEAEIHAWWGNNPDWDMALVCGHGGLSVVDTDTKELFGLLLQETGLEYTKIVETRRGAHFWFIEEYPSKSGPLMDGVDIKSRDASGRAGYVLVPPSKGYSVFSDVPIMRIRNAREWGAMRFGVSDKVNETKLYKDALQDGEIPTGQRNATIASIGGKLLSSGMDTKFIPDVLQAINKTMAGDPLTEDEVRATALSISRYEEKKDEEKKPWHTAWNKELEDTPPEQVKWLVEGLIPQASTTVLAGQEGVYKTYLSLELAYCLGEGANWLGKFPVENTLSLFVDGENGLDVIHERATQLRASTKKNMWQALFLMGEHLTDELAMKIIEHCKMYGFKLVFFDPYRLFMGGDEDKSGDTANFLRLMTKFHDQGIATLIQHHHRKQQDAFGPVSDPTTMSLRGSNALAAHASSIIQIAPVKEGIKIHHTKNRRGAKIDPFILEVAPGPTFTYRADVPETFGEQEMAARDIMELLSVEGKFRGQVVAALKGRFNERNIDRALKTLTEDGAIAKRKDGHTIWYYIPVDKQEDMFEVAKEMFSQEPRQPHKN